jgi:hypothetical protein
MTDVSGRAHNGGGGLAPRPVQAVLWMQTTWPNLFGCFGSLPRPLAIGVAREIIALGRSNAGFKRNEMQAALRLWTGSRPYLRAVVAEGAMRWTLDEIAVEPVTEGDRAEARERLGASLPEDFEVASFPPGLSVSDKIQETDLAIRQAVGRWQLRLLASGGETLLKQVIEDREEKYAREIFARVRALRPFADEENILSTASIHAGGLAGAWMADEACGHGPIMFNALEPRVIPLALERVDLLTARKLGGE